MRVGVSGHVDWIDFVVLDRVPAPGEIVQARETWGEDAGGGGMVAVRLARLAGEAPLCTALDDEGERTITLLTRKLRPRRSAPLPWEELGELDAVYFTGGDADALRAARAARVLVATPRELRTLREASVELDALVGSAIDPDERYDDGDLDPPPKLVFWTEGSRGGRVEPGGRRWEAPPLPGPYVDSYGAGDTFAAHLTFALAEGRSPAAAAEFAAWGAAEAITRRGAHGIHR